MSKQRKFGNIQGPVTVKGGPSITAGATRQGEHETGNEFFQRKHFGVGSKTLKTKIPITRPSGRPSAVETILLNELIRNAAIMKGWLIVNDRVATGKAVNSINIKITRSKAARALVNDRINVRNISTTTDDPNIGLKGLANLAKSTDIGFVTGRIFGAPHLKFALQGRGAGTSPPVEDIFTWMLIKGVGYQNTRYSLSQQARFISETIGAEGTKPPHFSANIRTKITRVSASKIVRNLADIFPKYTANRYVNSLVALGELYDNLEIRRVTPEEQEFERFI